MYKTILLDLDGTLMDSGEGIMRSAQYSLEKMGVKVDDWHTLRFFVGPPLEDSYKMFYGFSHEKALEAVRCYRERYLTVGRLEQVEYAGARNFLKRLHEAGLRVCLATSKMVDQTEFVINHFGLAPYINKVFARDVQGLIHTKGDVIKLALDTLGIENKAEVLMVGDREFDIIGANECGIDSAGVLYGYGSEEELQKAGATYICQDFESLLKVIF